MSVGGYLWCHVVSTFPLGLLHQLFVATVAPRAHPSCNDVKSRRGRVSVAVSFLNTSIFTYLFMFEAPRLSQNWLWWRLMLELAWAFMISFCYVKRCQRCWKFFHCELPEYPQMLDRFTTTSHQRILEWWKIDWVNYPKMLLFQVGEWLYNLSHKTVE